MKQNRISKILVVDDESSITDLIHLILTDRGYDVTAVKDGKEALRVFEFVKPDLVITDVVMPDMEGVELIRSLVKKRKGLPIIVMSGHPVGTKFLETARVFGARASLRKPFAAQELNEAIAGIEKAQS